MEFETHGMTTTYGTTPPPGYFHHAHLILDEEREWIFKLETQIKSSHGTGCFDRAREVISEIRRRLKAMEIEINDSRNTQPLEAEPVPAIVNATTQPLEARPVPAIVNTAAQAATNQTADGDTAGRTATATDQGTDGAGDEQGNPSDGDTPPSPGKTPLQVEPQDDAPNSRPAPSTLIMDGCVEPGETAHGDTTHYQSGANLEPKNDHAAQYGPTPTEVERHDDSEPCIDVSAIREENLTAPTRTPSTTDTSPSPILNEKDPPPPGILEVAASTIISGTDGDTAGVTANKLVHSTTQTIKPTPTHVQGEWVKDRGHDPGDNKEFESPFTDSQRDKGDSDSDPLHTHDCRQLESGEDNPTSTITTSNKQQDNESNTAKDTDWTPRIMQRTMCSTTTEQTDTATYGLHATGATAYNYDGLNCLRKLTDSEYMSEIGGVNCNSKEPIETYCVSAFDIYIDKDLLLNTRQLHGYPTDGRVNASVTTKTAPPRVKTMGRLDCKAKIHHWLVKRGG